MALISGNFLEALGGFCRQGLLGPLPSVLRSEFTFIFLLLVLIVVPLLMRQSGRWKWILISLPIYWAVITVFVILHGLGNYQKLPDAVGYLLMFALIAYAGVGVSVIIGNKHHRSVTSVLVAVNCYLAFFVTFLSAMALTGSWI